MDTTNQRKIILRQGKLMVFTRAASPFYQCRIKLPAKPYVYKSLNTVDEVEAGRLAEDLCAGAKVKADIGMPIRLTSVRSVGRAHHVALPAGPTPPVPPHDTPAGFRYSHRIA